MEVHIITLFPESIDGYLQSSIMKQAQQKGLFRYFLHNLADWTIKNTRRVDDRPYGWWAGTILTIEPLTKCIRDILQEYWEMPIFYMSPKWDILNQKKLQKLSKNEKIIIICGHYEWIDARIFDIFPITEVSIWHYVLSSGEIAAMVFIDGMVRLIDGVLSKDSLEEESFSDKLWWKKEYPQYSRPPIFEWLEVPEVLRSGNHKNIEQWKQEHLEK